MRGYIRPCPIRLLCGAKVEWEEGKIEFLTPESDRKAFKAIGAIEFFEPRFRAFDMKGIYQTLDVWEPLRPMRRVKVKRIFRPVQRRVIRYSN